MEAEAGGDERDEVQRGRIDRRAFIGGGLAAGGAALLNAGGAVAAQPRPATAASSTAARAIPGTSGPIRQLPIRAQYPNLPAVPVDEPGVLETLAKLSVRSEQTLQAKQGLSKKFTLEGVTRRGYAFLFDPTDQSSERTEREQASRRISRHPGGARGHITENLGKPAGAPAGQSGGPLSLESPEQFSISWTTFTGVYASGRRRLEKWASSLTDVEAATEQFWPMIAAHGLGYNLIVPERLTGARGRELRRLFGAAWTKRVRRALRDGDLYAVDMSRFESLKPHSVNGQTRFTPATITLLIRNPRKKSLKPVAVVVSGSGGSGRTVFSRSKSTKGAWLYALQAAKTSITVFGVWLGHVYHWHIVTTAMQMTMFNTLPKSHPVYQLLAPQSDYAIAFDDALLVLWTQIAPPTSLASGAEFLGLADDYAAGREFFDDDPKKTIKALGLRKRDFSEDESWDQYPVVQRLLEIWDLVEPFVETFVESTYASDAAVAADADLQRWITVSGSTNAKAGGNIRGLPAPNSRKNLKRILTSLVYRITVHGISRIDSTSNPALTFVSNFPHTLQEDAIPSPGSKIGTRKLLGYLPNTDAIASAVNFYFTFAFSTPYEPLIPLGGVRDELFFPGGLSDERNVALVRLRRGIASFLSDLQPEMPQRFQWPRNIET